MPMTETLRPAFRRSGPVLKAEAVGQWRDAQRHLAEAEAHAGRLRAEADAAFAAERERGHAEGLAQAREEAASLVAATGLQIDRYLAGLDQTLADLVQDTIERILGRFDRRELLLQAVDHALDMVEVLRGRLADPALADIGRRITVESDPGLAADTCVMVTKYGHVELGIDAQLRALRDALRRTRPGETAP
jgi:type III secretion protein L